MNDRDLTRGKWYELTDECTYDRVLYGPEDEHVDMHKGEWDGEGHYLLLEYSESARETAALAYYVLCGRVGDPPLPTVYRHSIRELIPLRKVAIEALTLRTNMQALETQCEAKARQAVTDLY